MISPFCSQLLPIQPCGGDSASGETRNFYQWCILTREQRFVLLLRKNLARPWDQSDYVICRTGLLMTRNSPHSAASITILFYQSTKNQAEESGRTKSGTLLAH